ncbi:hypothetical protein GCM10010411_76440 [Actinomadura fulvescens]|uniref:DUF1508 domain-containing protein n=1 Tax=Actinomadura fulvescens TaxID=46160 RepID=A0ABN3QJ72_9ACTN
MTHSPPDSPPPPPEPHYGYRAPQTPRHREHLALTAAYQAFVADAGEQRHPLDSGTLLLRLSSSGRWRFALLNPAGERVAVGTAHGDSTGSGLARTIAETLRRAPARADEPGATRPTYRPETIGHLMKMRRNSRTPYPRTDGTLHMSVPGARIIISPSALQAHTATGGIRLVLEGPWTEWDAAPVADAILRDLAPQAHHLTHTTEPRGYSRNESGSRIYDGSSWALCSCGWRYAASDRAEARALATWHRQHPTRHRTNP